jgi:hypothetical protein
MAVRITLPLLLTALLLATSACGNGAEPADEPESVNIPFDKEGTLSVLQSGDTLVTVDIEIAETDSARTRGLMQRTSLPDQSGMLFLFPNEQPRSFWMANTPLALDILFANADTTPFSQDNVRSGDPAQYVLEMPAGFADSYGVLEGDRLTWQRTD